MRTPRKLLSDERGIALPVALAVLLTVAGLATVAARDSITASDQSFRDRNVKRAFQAAAAGVETATYQTNLLQPGSSQCVVKSSSTGALSNAAVQSDNWCAPQTEDLGDGASYSVQVSSATSVSADGQALFERKVLSTGLVNGVKRRVLATARAATPTTPLFAGAAIVSLRELLLQNDARVEGDIASNADIRLKDKAVVCGDATPGPGKRVILEGSASQCSGYTRTPATQPITLTPVTIPATNDNARIGVQDPWTSKGSSTWNSSTRTLVVQDSATLELTGDVYVFCRLHLKNNGRLKVGPRTSSNPLKIYIDTPERCQGAPDPGSVMFENDATIVNPNPDPATFQLYVAGSPSTSTYVDFKNMFGAAVPMVIYAPNSFVMLQNDAAIIGAVAAKQVEMKNEASITWDDRVDGITTGAAGASVYKRNSWVECTSEKTGAAPDSGC
jgi:Tfp pilus assembly protein PilX